MNAQEQRLIERGDLAGLRALMERKDAAKRKAKARQRARPRRSPGLSREERKVIEDRRELDGKAAAEARAVGRCEWHTDGKRCSFPGTDADHVLGGRWKADMEALPNGEGFMWECRLHHELKHGPDKPESLEVAKEHALRIGSRGLLRHVERALARYRAKHPGAREPSAPVRLAVRSDKP